MKESEKMKKIQLRASELGFTTFRNNVGRLQTKQGVWVQYGLCVGSSDLIGWKPVTITQEMVGRKIAQFVAIEVKTPTGTATPQQKAFLDAVELAGGYSAISRDIDDIKS